MKHMIRFCFIGSLLFSVFFVSCLKESSKIPNQGSKANYQPVTAGSEWNYRVSGTSNYIYTVRAEDRDSIINGKSYRVFSNNKDPYEYYFKTGGDYYRFGSPEEFNYQPIDLLYIRDYLKPGEEWLEVETIKLGGVPVSAEVTVKILEKDIEYTVNNMLFKKVIHLLVTPKFVGGTFIPIGSESDIHYYYADSVGFIYNKTALKIPIANVNINKETKLVSYTIK